MLSILMPVYNEAERVSAAIDDAMTADLPLDHELLVVDDGSSDGTSAILHEAAARDGVTVLRHPRNQGKGAAVRTALAAATGKYAAILDADLEYSANDLNVLLEPLLAGQSRVAYGVRAFDGFTSHSFLYVLGNRSVTLAANILYNVYIHDLMTCHKAMEVELFRTLRLREPGFAVEAEITARLLNAGERIYEVPVAYRARYTNEGKKLTTVDGLRVVRTLLRCRLRP